MEVILLLHSAQFFLEMALEASMPWARVRPTCSFYKIFFSLSPSLSYMTAYLVSGRAEIIPAWASVLTLFWSLVTVFKLFSLCTTPHTCPFITFSYFPPCSLSLCAVSSHSFLCVSDNSCCQPPLPGVYSLLFFSLFSSSKLTLVLLALVSFIAHNFLVFSSFLCVLFFLAAVFHTLRDLLLAAPAMLTYQFPWASPLMLFTEMVIDHWFSTNLLFQHSKSSSCLCAVS